MSKVNFLLIYRIALMSIACGAILNKSPVYKNHRRIGFQDTSASQSINNYEQPPTAYDEKTHTYNTYLPPSSYGYGPAAPMPSQSSSNEYSNTQVHSTYGPPSYSYYPHSSYGPPTAAPYPYYPTAPQQPYEIDQKSHEGFFLKLIKKFDLVLMSKILLKLIIFKKIVKFIAVICLLLFLPALKKKFESIGGGYNEDEDRKYRILDSYGHVDSKIKEIANFALTAIEGFESHQIPWCVGDSEFYCRVQYMLDQIDSRYPGNRILSLWFPALTTTTTTTTASTPTNTTENESLEVHFNDYITDSNEKMSSIENAN
ncbi:hypothetical protein PVAND_001760 [Polypedilum vanderplanki]|uniref:Uncharacterized protein n=1 Tax=Polypedilum vanderplanki TaxID=319348 RepID=A0A9J6BPC1_POLVA|nr:hypothetical protein PVAND_001760 [Polypedilum vanderplanki]